MGWYVVYYILLLRLFSLQCQSPPFRPCYWYAFTAVYKVINVFAGEFIVSNCEILPPLWKYCWPLSEVAILCCHSESNSCHLFLPGTLIQTAEGKSILIPSQPIAQQINIQALSVATPIAPPPVQQPAQNSLASMILAHQQQQQQQQHQQQQTVAVDNRNSQGKCV